MRNPDKKEYVEIGEKEYDFCYSRDGQQGRLVIGYNHCPATGVGRVGFEVRDEVVEIGPSNVDPLRVNSMHQGNGLGATLIRRVLGYVIHNYDISRAMARTQHDNGAAIHTFKKEGFERNGEPAPNGLVTLVRDLDA